MSTSWRKSAVAAVAESRKHNSSLGAAMSRRMESSVIVDQCIHKHETRRDENGKCEKHKALYIH